MTLNEIVELLEKSDNIRIVKDSQPVYVGYLGLINASQNHIEWENIKLTGNEIVEKLRCEQNITHRKWKELHLKPPYEPEKLADYRFNDMQVSTYYTLYIRNDRK